MIVTKNVLRVDYTLTRKPPYCFMIVLHLEDAETYETDKVMEFFCFNHGSRLRAVAEHKWKTWCKCQGSPADSAMALDVALAGALKEPVVIMYDDEKVFNKILKIKWREEEKEEYDINSRDN